MKSCVSNSIYKISDLKTDDKRTVPHKMRQERGKMKNRTLRHNQGENRQEGPHSSNGPRAYHHGFRMRHRNAAYDSQNTSIFYHSDALVHILTYCESAELFHLPG
uniref:Uncharacterized protein n=1 Tax=Candidatus Kentrum sp. TC TaxID=2126339 RepID=A0A450YXR9_9GAMM|nr:MAG: hypothetical protein BECKTC1821E_GA0114239_10626 [Candidatus Kentron sp. TC]